MNQKYIKLLILFSIALTGFLFFLYYLDAIFSLASFGKKGAIHIAVAVPMTGKDASHGKSVVNGVQMYTEMINRQGGINGKKVILDIYDDMNDTLAAKEKATEIVQQGQALALIGHYLSSCSAYAGEVYKEHGIPAVTPASIDIDITQKNDWYFRTINNNHLQGRFAVNYLKNIAGIKTAGIIYENHPYGINIVRVFEKTCQEIGIEIKYKNGFTIQKNLDVDIIISDIVEELFSEQETDILFLATRAPAGIELVKQIRDSGIRTSLGGPETFASKTFREGFSNYPIEKIYPGYYTNNIIVSSCMLFDSANEKAQKFKDRYTTLYKEEPESDAAFAYDAAMVIFDAIKNAGIQGKKSTIKEDRRKIRDYLTQLNHIDYSVEGVTGYNFFDENGDVSKDMYIGIYKSNRLISALTQIRNIHYLNEISDVDKAVKNSQVLIVDNKYMYVTKVAKIGLQFNEISEIDIKKLTCMLDFNLWFRYQGRLNINNIVFHNAAGDIELKEPVEEKTEDYLSYRLFNVKAKFKMDCIPSQFVFGQHVISISFHHRTLTRNNLVYVTDIVGMGVTAGNMPIEKIKKDGVITQSDRWGAHKVWFFQGSAEENPQGRPEYLNLQKGVLEHSSFNAAILVKKKQFTIRGIIPFKYVNHFMIISGILFIMLLFALRLQIVKPVVKLIYLFQAVVIFILVLSLEIFLINWQIEKTDTYYQSLVVRIFDMLWWITPAFLLIQAMELFVWTPLEEKTGHAIPGLVRKFIAFIIYILAVFCILVFVFDQKITGLLATSGVFAMIIGLAIQVNISNIFSGVAINAERPFRIGDWVIIGEFEEGEVTDITWRKTRLKTRDGCVLSIPNSTVSESYIKNFHYPDDVYELWFPVYVDPKHTPARVEKILLDAALSVDIVLKDPFPITRLSGGLKDWAAKYYLVVCVKGRAKMNQYRGIIWKSILNHLHRTGITPARRQEVHMFRGTKTGDEDAAGPCAVLKESDIFKSLSEESIAFISRHMRIITFSPGEIIISQGDTGGFIICYC